jgi:hypothetical protein
MVEDLGMDGRRVSTLKDFGPTAECTNVELEDLVGPDVYHRAFEQAYASILEQKRTTIKRTALQASQCSRTKPYEDYFKKQGLGKFDKVAVAKALADICADVNTGDAAVGADTVEKFARLFEKLIEMLKAER